MLSLLALAFAEEVAAPPAPPAKPEVSVGGMLFAHYRYDLDPAAKSANEFDLDRAYLTANARLPAKLAVRLTLDADRHAADDKLRVFVKNAWLEWREPAPGMKVRAGVVDTGWAPYIDSFTGLRYVSKSLTDDKKVVSTADFGVNVQGEQLKGLLDFHVAFINGEGYSKPEADSGKTVTARVAVDPMAPKEKMKLPIAAYVGYALPPEGGEAVLTYAGGLGLKNPFVVFWAEYVGVSEGDLGSRGFSVLASPRYPKVASLILRFDQWDPDTDADDDAENMVIAGVAHDFFEKVSLSASYQREWTEGSEDTPSHGALAQIQAGF